MKALLVWAIPSLFGLVFGGPEAQFYSGLWLLVLGAAGIVDFIRRPA